MKRLIIGITGASGHVYAKKFIEDICVFDYQLHIVITDNGKKVFEYELDQDFNEFILGLNKDIIVHDNLNMFSSIASGSFSTDGMIILPASMATVAKIAGGISDTLILRAADVVIKEGRKLIICPRESPLSAIHLNNLLTLSRLNVVINPLFPAFYRKPESIEELVEGSIERVLGMFNLEVKNKYEWGN